MQSGVSTSQTHFQALDSWRGISALMVVLFHFTALGHLYHLPLVRHSYLFVDFFFVLSGFVITHATLSKSLESFSLSGFVAKRVARIYPLHLVMLLAFVAAEALNLLLASTLNFKTGNPPFAAGGYRSLETIPEHLFLLQALNVSDRLTWNFPSWSISAEFWTYLVLAGLMIACSRRLTLALAAVGLSSAVVVAALSPRGIETTFDLGFLRCLFGFSIGHLTYRLYQATPKPPVSKLGMLELVSVVAVIVFVSNYADGLPSMLAPVVFGCVVYVFSFERGPISRILVTSIPRRLGQISYSIYMVHAFIITMIMTAAVVAQKVLGRALIVTLDDGAGPTKVIGNLNPFAIDALMVVYLAVVVMLSCLTWRYIEVPGQKLILAWSSRVRRDRRAYY